MDRTHVVTGSASGIGASTSNHFREQGTRVIGCDLRDADGPADTMLSLYFFGAVAKLEGLRPWRISLNVVAPGFVDTPAAAYIVSEPDPRAAAERMVPLRGALPGRPEQMAGALAWCVSPENSLMTGQIMSIDAGVERMARGENAW